jgi:GT2 family glycosyltransferase
VNFYSTKEISACLKSLDNVHQDQDYEVIIVSNSPVDREDESDIDNLLSSTVKWLCLQENIGYGRACNKGASISSGDYLAFINPDTLFINDALTVLKSNIENHGREAIAGPATYTQELTRTTSVKNEVSLLWMLNWVIPILGLFFSRGRPFNPTHFESKTKVYAINGSAICMPRSAFLASGGFSDDYFMYWEENDLCVRLKQHGYDILFIPDAKIIHTGGHSTKKIFLPMEIQKHRSQKIFIKKHHPNIYPINRFCGIMAYSWRYLTSLLTFQSKKQKQYFALLSWYLVRYE